ncbi:ORF112 [Leucania separata nucleopolyhedrovirus]|uniref:ORF108 protein n=1 Tax=Leucania separata nucleopolyhedrovirus TaxID=1307956 RepID=O55577_NPVLS|nr:ORF112 [Leucania separata nucleopolyhedrovirus]AAR28876.1 ORF112 [Leucania separata nucleopolyhedrovirus]BAA24253.1 ORF108 [Leucania separata nucleopolyhedrovirus]
MNALYENATRQPSVLDYDQLGQMVSRNRLFLRDFMLVLCALFVFVIMIVFILLIFNISRTVEMNRLEEMRYLGNYDYTGRTVPPPTNPNANIDTLPPPVRATTIPLGS